MTRAYYWSEISQFLVEDTASIIGKLAQRAALDGPLEPSQVSAWETQIRDLRKSLATPAAKTGAIFFEYAVPRLGKRIDNVIVLNGVVFVLEFKVAADRHARSAAEQVWDYALDLKNFHETSHDKLICPVLVSTLAPVSSFLIETSARDDGVLIPIRCNSEELGTVVEKVCIWKPQQGFHASEWDGGRYAPTPSIIEAALSLYAGHGVAEISRSDAAAKNLRETSQAVEAVIEDCRRGRKKAICFVTGVPGAGKTLVGLNIATLHAQQGETHSVLLSGNGPLVDVLREALARDQVSRSAANGERISKAAARTQVKAFIQNVHHFRDEYLRDARPPIDHVAVFDEAQRAWNHAQTAAFMARKRGMINFSQSEPEFLISCMDRHPDWAVVVCLVGGGQEINTGEAGIRGWLEAVERSFPHWEVHLPARLRDSEYGVSHFLEHQNGEVQVSDDDRLHLGVSMRSFRAEHLSRFVKQVLDIELEQARQTLLSVLPKYPIILCRDVGVAKQWLRQQARGSERYGMVVSSSAERLRPHAIHVRSPMDPVHWFLDEKDDVRSSYYMEDVATEFHVQGLELDWACVVWDGDFRRTDTGWSHHSFVGSRWQNIKSEDRQRYQKNAYRVLLTRARQGMAIVVPQGSEVDGTRDARFYDSTYRYLQDIGLPTL